MAKVIFRSLLLCALSGCTTSRDVAVVDVEPDGCVFLEELSFGRWCDTEGKVYPEDFQDFRRLAKRIGADALVCCRLDEEVITVIGHGKGASSPCVETRMRYARAFRCGKARR